MGTRAQAVRGHLVRERAVEEGVDSRTWKVTLRGTVTLPEVAGAVITPFPLFLPFPGHSFGWTESKKSKQVSDSWESVSWVREQVQKNGRTSRKEGEVPAALATAIHGRPAIGQLLRTQQRTKYWAGQRVCLGFSIRCWPTQDSQILKNSELCHRRI